MIEFEVRSKKMTIGKNIKKQAWKAFLYVLFYKRRLNVCASSIFLLILQKIGSTLAIGSTFIAFGLHHLVNEKRHFSARCKRLTIDG